MSPYIRSSVCALLKYACKPPIYVRTLPDVYEGFIKHSQNEKIYINKINDDYTTHHFANIPIGRLTYSYVNDLLDGMVTIKQQRNVIMDGYFINGLAHGMFRQYVGGIIYRIETWENDKLHGPYIMFWENGVKRIEETYHRGKLYGLIREWDTSGVLIRAKYVVANSIVVGEKVFIDIQRRWRGILGRRRARRRMIGRVIEDIPDIGVNFFQTIDKLKNSI